jgi:hypothetical protein
MLATYSHQGCARDETGHGATLEAVLDGFAQWWDGVELWLTQLPFALQFSLVIAFLLPLCLGVARLIDRVVDWGTSRVTPDEQAEPPVGALAEDLEEPDKVDVATTS